MKKRFAAIILAGVFMCGCNIGDDYPVTDSEETITTRQSSTVVTSSTAKVTSPSKVTEPSAAEIIPDETCEPVTDKYDFITPAKCEALLYLDSIPYPAVCTEEYNIENCLMIKQHFYVGGQSTDWVIILQYYPDGSNSPKCSRILCVKGDEIVYADKSTRETNNLWLNNGRYMITTDSEHMLLIFDCESFTESVAETDTDGGSPKFSAFGSVWDFNDEYILLGSHTEVGMYSSAMYLYSFAAQELIRTDIPVGDSHSDCYTLVGDEVYFTQPETDIHGIYNITSGEITYLDHLNSLGYSHAMTDEYIVTATEGNDSYRLDGRRILVTRLSDGASKAFDLSDYLPDTEESLTDLTSCDDWLCFKSDLRYIGLNFETEQVTLEIRREFISDKYSLIQLRIPPEHDFIMSAADYSLTGINLENDVHYQQLKEYIELSETGAILEEYRRRNYFQEVWYSIFYIGSNETDWAAVMQYNCSSQLATYAEILYIKDNAIVEKSGMLEVPCNWIYMDGFLLCPAGERGFAVCNVEKRQLRYISEDSKGNPLFCDALGFYIDADSDDILIDSRYKIYHYTPKTDSLYLTDIPRINIMEDDCSISDNLFTYTVSHSGQSSTYNMLTREHTIITE